MIFLPSSLSRPNFPFLKISYAPRGLAVFLAFSFVAFSDCRGAAALAMLPLERLVNSRGFPVSISTAEVGPCSLAVGVAADSIVFVSPLDIHCL